MRTTLFTFCFFIVAVTAFSQQSKTYEGIVKDANSLKNIPFATVALYNNHELIDGISTNDQGEFQIQNERAFTHFEVSFIGYDKVILSLAEIDNPGKILVLLEASASELNEVVVQAERTTTELKIDRKVINLGADLQQSGTTVLEAFDQVSEIQTDLGSGSLSLRGSGNVRVLINGKPSALNAVELLEQLPASSVQEIEIITSPSARNLADGLSGIINIVLKKDTAHGLNLALNSAVGTKRYSYGLAGNYNFSWINIRWNASQAKREMDSEQTIGQRYTNDDTRDFFTPHDFSGNTRKVAAGVDFFINDRNELSVGLDYTNDYHTFYNNTFYTNVTGREDYVYVRNSSHLHKTTNINTNYRRVFNQEGHFLEFDYNLTKNENLLPATDFEEGIFLFEEERKNENSLQALALDYTLPIGDNIKIETGFSWNARVLTSYNYFNASQNTPTLEAFDYKENLFGVYALTKFNTGEVNWQVGLRHESFTSDSELISNNRTVHLKFNNLFPSFHASYKIGEAHTLNMGYSKRVSRPNFNHINPFRMGNQYFQWVANPSLKPEFSSNFEFNYQYVNNKFSTAVSTFYRYRTDVIESLRHIDGDGVLIINFDNIGKKHSYGIETDLQYKLMEFWNTQLSANYYYTNINQNIYLSWNQLYSSSIIFKNTFKISKKISTDITYRHTFKTQRAFEYIEPRNRIDWAVRVKLLDNKLTANLRIIDVLDDNLMHRKTVTQEVLQKEVWNFQSQTFGFLFSVNYKLFQNKEKVRTRKDRDYEHRGSVD